MLTPATTRPRLALAFTAPELATCETLALRIIVAREEVGKLHSLCRDYTPAEEARYTVLQDTLDNTRDTLQAAVEAVTGCKYALIERALA